MPMTSGEHPPRPGLLLIFSQTFVPDPAAVGQYVADAAAAMADRGYHVRVYTSARGYEDPSKRYPLRQDLGGVDVRRLPFASFGKRSLFTRGIGVASFLTQCLFVGLWTRNLRGILFSTSPPMIGVAAALIRLVRRVPIIYWAMDLNPDQLLALGQLSRSHPVTALLEQANRFVLRHASLTIALDRFMADRIRSRRNIRCELLVTPPWPHEQHLHSVPHAENPFRQRHRLTGKFVVMYSGNHSPSNPLQTILDAALRLRDDPDLLFLFVGGGVGKQGIVDFAERHSLHNILLLPYQPLEDLRFSLSAADVHLVSMGDEMVGIIHPCKVYGAMAVARPILYLGPRPSHVSDLSDEFGFGMQIPHGGVDQAVAAIQALRRMGDDERAAMGSIALRVLASNLSMSSLVRRFCDAIQRTLTRTPPRSRRDSLGPNE
jgi:colanic acid biosynthesis glycosyl transferase WcaI